MESFLGPATRRRGFPGGLRAQLLIGLGGLLLATLTLVSIVSVHTTRLHLQQMQLENVYRLGTLLAAENAEKLATGAEEIERFRRGGGLDFAGLWSAETKNWEAAQVDRVQAEVERALEGLVTEVSAENAVKAHKIVQTADDLQLVAVVQGENRAFAGVSVSLAPVQAKIDDAKALVFWYLLLDLLFITIVGYAFFTYLVVRPIRAIGVASERAAAGDLASPITLLPGNEFGQVGRSFNHMLAELDQNREELQTRLQAIERMNRELSTAQDSLVRAEKLASVGQLSAGVAHEIGNPLAAILGYTDLLRDADLEQDMREDIVDRVQVQLERIQKTIGELLDFSRDESEQAAEPTELGRCVEEALHWMRAHPRAQGVEFFGDVTADLPLVHAVHSAVVQVLLNLMINAADALHGMGGWAGDFRPGVWLATDVSEDGSSVVLQVRDNGPGISEAAVHRLFDPFFTTKDPGQGTGLGLATCLRIMQRFGGDIRVQNLEGPHAQGAAFELVFRAVSQADPLSVGTEERHEVERVES